MKVIKKLIDGLFDAISTIIVVVIAGCFICCFCEYIYDITGLKAIIEGEEEDSTASIDEDAAESDTIAIDDLISKDQSTSTDDDKLSSTNDYVNRGSMKSLHGNICVAITFIATEDDDWTEQSKQVAIDSLFRAERWLKSEVERYGSDIEFNTVSFDDRGTIYVDNIPTNPDDDDKENGNGIVHNVHLALGLEDMADAAASLKERHDCDNVVMVVFAKGTGRAWAETYSRADEKYKRTDRFLESCIIFTRKRFDNGSTRPMNAGTIAHEILHLAGAWDLYKDSAQPNDHAEKAEEFFPKSIMIQSGPHVGQRQIDPLTAWLVGINDNPQSWYAWFDPGNNEEWALADK